MAKSKKGEHERVDITGKEMQGKSLSELLNCYLGMPISLICARFNYRGILSSVGSDHCILAMARAVEESGPSSGSAPLTEDVVGSSVIISLNAVEIVMQPNWCFAPLE